MLTPEEKAAARQARYFEVGNGDWGHSLNELNEL